MLATIGTRTFCSRKPEVYSSDMKNNESYCIAIRAVRVSNHPTIGSFQGIQVNPYRLDIGAAKGG
jgi:hypothetical protein